MNKLKNLFSKIIENTKLKELFSRITENEKLKDFSPEAISNELKELTPDYVNNELKTMFSQEAADNEYKKFLSWVTTNDELKKLLYWGAAAVVLVIIAALFSIGDPTDKNSSSENSLSSSETSSDKVLDENPNRGGCKTSYPTWPKDKNGWWASYEYNGGEIEVDISINATAPCDSVGFLIYLNGEPVTYKIKGVSEEDKFIHIVRGVAGSGDLIYTIVLTPYGFAAGDTATISFETVENPGNIVNPTEKESVLGLETDSDGDSEWHFSREIVFNAGSPAENTGV